MERPSRRAAAIRDSGDVSSNNSSSLRHRRRHNASRANSNTSASQSDDGADTDASSVAAHDAGSSNATRNAGKKLLPPRDAKKRGSQRGSENPAVDENGAADADAEVDDDDELDEEDEQSGSESRGTAGAAAGKRERSMSNVSTTSSSSSVASERDERDREAMHVEKLKELEKKKKMVEDGTLAEFCRRVTEFKEERNQLLETAEWHKNLQLKNSEDLYGFEVQRAHDLWQQGKEALKSSLLQQVDALVLTLQQELADLSNAEASASADPERAASTLSDATEQEDAASEPSSDTIRTKGLAPAASKRRKVGGVTFQETTVRLPLDEIDSDLASILGDRVQRAEDVVARLKTTAVANFRSERRRVHCGKYVFEDGDEVVVSSPVISEDYIGTISSVTEDAVYIKLTSGQRVRVYRELIAHKRCHVKPFLRGAAGVRALQGTGWAECEPF